MSTLGASPRVEFHELRSQQNGDPLAPVLALTIALWRQGRSLLILAVDGEQARQIDLSLWAADPALFLPHALADDAHPAAAAVLIAAPTQTTAPREVVLNLRQHAVAFECPHIIELIPVDQAGKQAARERWRSYTARGCTPIKTEFGLGPLPSD